MVSVVMHYNPGLPHQVRHAEAFKAVGVEVTPAPCGDADVHIVSGPHFALARWLNHPNVIFLDRAFYGDPEYVSMGWMNPDGSRTFATGDTPRPKPEPKPWKKWMPGECRALVLPDYQQDATALIELARERYNFVTLRRHPAELKPAETLAEQLEAHHVAIGHSSTALFDAVIAGLPVICTDPLNVVAEVSQTNTEGVLRRPDRTDWLHRVSWMQWNHEEFGHARRLLLAQRGFA